VPKLTRREFLKLSGQALAATGTASLTYGLMAPTPAQADTPIELDGKEMVGRVGDTFATITLVPRFTKSDTPETIQGKVQYGTNPTLATHSESPVASTAYYTWVEDGRHHGPDGSDQLVVSRKYKLLSFDIAPGDLIENKTDGSVMVVSAVADDRTIAGTLSGGARNVWNQGDKWRIDRTYYRLELELTDLAPGTTYYYRVLARKSQDDWQPRALHSFRTRPARGETFRFGIFADPHRSLKHVDNKHWPEWSQLIAAMQAEQVDFVFDLGDTWCVTKPSEAPVYKHLHELYANVMRPTRNGFQAYAGVSKLCADCGYYQARGNHEGISDFEVNPARSMLRAIMKQFVPNPSGTTYPQGGSQDSDYDQGYFAFEWGDALFIALDVVKYKDSRKVRKSPARYHIGEDQLAWLTSVLQNSTARWKLLFAHHLFGGACSYGRGGAAWAQRHEQAQIQALCEQYGAHYIYGHDHLMASEFANGVLYYCAGCAWGLQFPYGTSNHVDFDVAYPNGFTSTSCKSKPSACDNNGYTVVEVSADQVLIQYKGYKGNVIHETVLV